MAPLTRTVAATVATLIWSGSTPLSAADAIAIGDGIAPVTPANTVAEPRQGTWQVLLTAPDRPEVLTVIDPDAESRAAGMLRGLYYARKAAGLWRVVYDNRDNGHSDLGTSIFPQIVATRYAESLRRAGMDTGAAGRLRFGLPVIGNSSTAITGGPLKRSLGRWAVADQADAERSFALYASNHFYVYPEHRDHDMETGDRFFANVPFFVMSQGSSHSDRVFLRAAAMALGALTPATRAVVEEAGLIAPTLQMVMRRSLEGVESRADYLSGQAHPSAFAGGRLRPEKMVALANSLTPETVPPMVRLDVVKDFEAQPGRDYFAGNLGESVFTTPAAISRVWRSYDYTREIVLSADATEPLTDAPVRFHWVVLRGDPEKIRITPEGPRDGTARIAIDWHDAITANAPDGMGSTRIDIGVFADTGTQLSAPSILSVSLPLYQGRNYEPIGPDGRMRLTSLDYRRSGGDPYADPTLWLQARVQDEIGYGPSGIVNELRRTDRRGAVTAFAVSESGFLRPRDDESAPWRLPLAAFDGPAAISFVAPPGSPVRE